MESTLIHVIIADDHPIVRQGLEMVINTQSDMTLIGQAADGDEALKIIINLHPDVVVMDLKMPGKNGLVTIQEIEKLGLDVKILVLTSFPEDDMVLSTIRAGADAVLLKDSPPEYLIDSIRAVHRGESVLHPVVAKKLMKKYQQAATSTPIENVMTSREIDVLECVAQGLSNREIAGKLSISTRTVTTHVQNILDKLGLENRTQAALYAVEQGIAKKPEE
jgi:DNA-binding NarL/FixJ family response regulator